MTPPAIKNLKMQIVKNQKSKYGEFDLIPDKGCEIVSHFTDLESGLLIVSESKIPNAKKTKRKRTKTTPVHYTIIDSTQQKILTKKDLEALFFYEKQELLHPEHNLKTIITRIHDAERNFDTFESQLINMDTGEVVTWSKSVAFSNTPRQSLYESYLAAIEDRKKRDAIRYGEYLDEWYEQDLAQLKDGLLMRYWSRDENYELIRQNGRCLLYRNSKSASPDNPDKNLFQSFDSPGDFWAWFIQQPDWYLVFKPGHVDRIFAKDLIYYLNDLHKNHALEFNDRQHYQIYTWGSKVYTEQNRHAYVQYCVRCDARVMYYPRYPRHICKDCCKLLTRRDGKPLDWLKVEKRMWKSTGGKVRVYIGKEIYWAQEARFGGIVVQK